MSKETPYQDAFTAVHNYVSTHIEPFNTMYETLRQAADVEKYLADAAPRKAVLQTEVEKLFDDRAALQDDVATLRATLAKEAEDRQSRYASDEAAHQGKLNEMTRRARASDEVEHATLQRQLDALHDTIASTQSDLKQVSNDLASKQAALDTVNKQLADKAVQLSALAGG